jgi:hypothetical protein
LRLGRRLRDALKRLRARRIEVAMSQPAATAFALARIADDVSPEVSISLLNSAVFQVSNPSLTREAAAAFLEYPDFKR